MVLIAPQAVRPRTAARLFVAAALLAVLGVKAQTTPTGLWKTIDDDGRTEKSLVRITDQSGVWTGRIEKVFDPARQGAVCDKCSDERKGQPVVGLAILRNVKAGGEAGLWEGGDITDPNNGKVYKVRLRPIEDGRKLEVRGFVGFSLLGRTQTWVRVE